MKNYHLVQAFFNFSLKQPMNFPTCFFLLLSFHPKKNLSSVDDDEGSSWLSHLFMNSGRPVILPAFFLAQFMKVTKNKQILILLYLAYWNPFCLCVGINADFSSLKLAFTYFSISNKLCFYTWNMAMDPWSLFRSKWTWQHWVHPNWPLNWVLLLRKCNDSHSKLKILQQLPKK